MSSHASSSFAKLTPEILERIAFYTVALTFHGPPSDVCNLCLISRTLNNALKFENNKHLYSSIFRFKFDTAALFRRLSVRWRTARCLASELKKRCIALKRIRQKNTHHVEDLWTAYLMMLESDGRNERQLVEWAGIEDFLQRTIIYRLHPTQGMAALWYTDIQGTALTVWLLWMTTTKDGLRKEIPTMRRVISTLLHPFIAAGFRYPTLHAPDSHFILPLCSELDGAAPHSSGPSPTCADLTHLGHRLRITIPFLTTAAVLSTTVRMEIMQDGNPLPPSIEELPLTRAAAIAAHWHGATAEDVADYHYRTRIRLPIRRTSEHDADDGMHIDSRRYDEDWSRLVSCYDPFDGNSPLRGTVYTPGTLTGSWAGRIWPNFNHYFDLLSNPTRPTNSVPIYHYPLYMTLQEHHCLHPDDPLSPGLDEYEGDDILNAWLPREYHLRHVDGGIEVYDGNTERYIRYETFSPTAGAPYCKAGCDKLTTPWISDSSDEEIADDSEGLESVESLEPSYVDNDDEYEDKVTPRSSGVTDILVTGQTGERHSNAWGHYTIVGRIRPWDGLVVLLRTPVEETRTFNGQWIFRGYIHDQNLVGRWRETSTAADTIGYEGAFVLYKDNDL